MTAPSNPPPTTAAPISPGSRPLLVLLGNTNDASGNLSPMARQRIARAAELWRELPGLRILPTGAFGAHFNTTDRPHHQYLGAALRAAGVPPEAILPGTDSANTVEDARLSRAAVEAYAPSTLGVLTNRFHLARARHIFAFFYRRVPLWFEAAPDGVDGEVLAALEAHERQALHRLHTDWPLSSNGL